MNRLVKLGLAAAIMSMLLTTGNAASGSGFPHATELEVALFGHTAPLLHSGKQCWRSAVKRANLAVNQSVAGELWGRERVRVKFADGGWVEFQPTPVSISTDALPRILAIQFSRAGKAVGVRG